MLIEFVAGTKEAFKFVTPPKPAKNYIPQWFKDIPPFNPKKPEWDQEGNLNLSVKNCLPFVDSLTAGYIQETWAEIYVGTENEKLVVRQADGPAVLQTRPKVNTKIDENEFYPFEFTWQQHFIAKLPNGYSSLIVHPLNRFDLPFVSMSGIVDNDVFDNHQIGNIPFYIKKSFTGFIPIGTPMFQLIPFKRDNWDSKIAPFDEDEMTRKYLLNGRHFKNFYRNFKWQKKTFN